MGVWNLNEKGMGGVSVFGVGTSWRKLYRGWGSFCITKYVGGSWERDIFCAYYRTKAVEKYLASYWGLGIGGVS